MINDLNKTSKHIIKWIKDYANNAGIKTLIVGLSGGIDSALVALLCKKTGITTLCVNMPCNSSSSAYDRAQAFANEQNLTLLKVDLTSSHESIYEQYRVAFVISPGNAVFSRESLGGLSSCLRAPTLSFLALSTKGLIIGTGNRSEDNLTRYYQKFGDGCVDISPIADLFKSEVYELYKYMALNEDAVLSGIFSGTMSDDGWPENELPASIAIYRATPTADLWGPDGGHEDESELGISYDEIEWADRENMRCSIVTNDENPMSNSAWLGYSGRQKEVIAKMHQLEKISRHKHNPNLPVCEIRTIEGLVR